MKLSDLATKIGCVATPRDGLVKQIRALQSVGALPRDRFCNKEDSPPQHRHRKPPTDYSDKGCPLYYEKLLPLIWIL